MPHVLTYEEVDREAWWARRGPAALAALLGLSLEDIRSGFREQDPRPGLSQMANAVRRFAGSWRLTAVVDMTVPSLSYMHIGGSVWRRGAAWPERGLLLVQFSGPWDSYSVDAPEQFAHTHWVAVRDGRVFDELLIVRGCPSSGWTDIDDWKIHVVQEAASWHRHATGIWWPRVGLEVPC